MEIIEITSTQNDLVKYSVKLQNSKFRKSQKLIFADGQKTIEGFINDGIVFEYFFCKKDNILSKKVKTKKLIYVTDEILKKITTTKSPSDVAGIIKEKEIDKIIFYKLDKIALLENIKDAGNLGTIIRSAVAFGIDGIILFDECVDLFNSKTIRATAQNIFKIPIITTKDINFIKNLKKTHKFISTVVDGKNDLFKYNFSDKFVLAFGSESNGLSTKIVELSDEKLSIFMENNVESINLAICASIVFALTKINR